MAGSGHETKFGFAELLVFLAALVAGTSCSLTSKMLLGMKSIGMTGEEEAFEKPLFQTFTMFLGMTCALGMHWLVVAFKIPFPGYNHGKKKGEIAAAANRQKGYSAIDMEDRGNDDDEHEVEANAPIPMWMYFLLIIPAMFDLIATALCMFGLLYIDVSIYQMLRGGAIVFVAILKQTVLGDKLKKFMWVGVGFNVLSILLVGLTAMLATSGGDGTNSDKSLYGVVLVLAGAFVQSLQYAFEEKVMTMEIAAPPLLLIGMEGFWGTVVCLVALYPVLYNMPGDDHGSYEDPFNTWAMLKNSTELQWMFLLYFFSIFFYNMLAVLVTYMLNSVWHAILDNFRPITVWGTDLFVFYCVSAAFGEAWTAWSYLQLLGMFVLLYGTAVYNAPNAGSILLTGKWYDFFLDFSDEYEEVEEADESAFGSAKGTSQHFSPYMSPFRSPRTESPSRPRAPVSSSRGGGGS